MAIFLKRYMIIFLTLFVSMSTEIWSSEHYFFEEQHIEEVKIRIEEDIDLEQGIVDEKEEKVRIQIKQEFDLSHELLKDAEQSVLRSHKTDRSWYYTLRNAYALTGEVLIVSSTILDVVTVISAGVGATLYGDNEAGRISVIVAGVAEICSIAFAKTGNHAMEASRKYAKYLKDLNDQDMGLVGDSSETEQGSQG